MSDTSNENETKDNSQLEDWQKQLQERSQKVAAVIGPIFDTLFDENDAVMLLISWGGNPERITTITKLHPIDRMKLLGMVLPQLIGHVDLEFRSIFNQMSSLATELMRESEGTVEGELTDEDESNDRPQH